MAAPKEMEERDHSVRTIRKIPPGMRRRKPAYAPDTPWYRRLVLRWRDDTQFQRTSVQLAFVLLCVWIGVEFHLFMMWGESNGDAAFVSRPPGVEGFLPISALMSLKYWWETGIVNSIHPASLFILLAVVAVSFALRKSFCSWLCPIGTLSESLWLLGRKIFRNNLTLPRWLDYPLRSLKYLLLLFFAYSVMSMGVPALEAFIHSPYNKVADIKMYLFFAHMSEFAFWTIAALVVLSVIIKNFWCRFLCPYGALLGIVGWLSSLKVTRTTSSCIDCELCTKACPSDIRVHALTRVWSDECTSCLQCVEACPVKNTLMVRPARTAKAVPTWVFGILVSGVFVAVTGLALLTGNWQNSIRREEYLRRFQELDTPLYQHFHGQVPEYGPND